MTEGAIFIQTLKIKVKHHLTAIYKTTGRDAFAPKAFLPCFHRTLFF